MMMMNKSILTTKPVAAMNLVNFVTKFLLLGLLAILIKHCVEVKKKVFI